LKRIAKGAGFDEHVEAARPRARGGIKLSAIFLLGVGGVARSRRACAARRGSPRRWTRASYRS
jgi:hypothetical protein